MSGREMKLPFKSLSVNAKLLIIFFLVISFAAFNYLLFRGKTEKIAVYDDLSSRLSSIRVSIIKLEYTLDMFIVAERFEATTVALIKTDVARLDRSINEVTGNQRFRDVVAENGLLSEGLSSISNEWRTTLGEIARLDEATTKEELMLTHNVVDMHTILVTEVSDRLLGVISETRNTVYEEVESLALRGIIAAVVFFMAAAFVFARRISAPAAQFAETAAKVSSGDLTARFGLFGSGVMGRLAGELNAMLRSVNSEAASRGERIEDLKSRLKAMDGQLSALNLLFSYEGKSLSQSEILSSAVQLAVMNGRSDSTAVYVRVGSVFRLKASAGFDDFFLKEASFIPEGAMGTEEGKESFHIYEDTGAFPYERLGKLFKSCGFSTLLFAPLRFGGEVVGYLFAAAKEGNRPFDREAHFFEALSLNLSVFIGNLNMFYREHNSKKFLERVLNQVPIGLAVFDKAGGCVFANSMLKRFLNADAELAGEYKIFEDDILKGQGMLSSIRKAYDGYSTEFIINYNPALVEKFSFSGAARRLKIRSIPLYDTGGDISNIALLYEDVTEAAGTGAEGAGTKP